MMLGMAESSEEAEVVAHRCQQQHPFFYLSDI